MRILEPYSAFSPEDAPTVTKWDYLVQTAQWIQLLYLKTPVELGMITALSFCKCSGADSAPILLVTIKREYCHGEEEGQKTLIKKCVTPLLLKYSCWGQCGIYNKVQKVMGSSINEISWSRTGFAWEFLGRKSIFNCFGRGWPAS